MLSTHRGSSNPFIQVKTLTKQTLNVKQHLWAAERFLLQCFDLPVWCTGPGLFLYTALEFHKALHRLTCYSPSLFFPFSPPLHPSIHPDVICWSKGDHGKYQLWHTKKPWPATTQTPINHLKPDMCATPGKCDYSFSHFIFWAVVLFQMEPVFCWCLRISLVSLSYIIKWLIEFRKECINK